MEILDLNRKALIERTEREDERSDLKQHADKMLRDFEKFNDFSSNRAIWELVQNACDLSLEADITFDYRDNKIAFSHHGKPFDTKSLISLIKQVSGKYGESEDIPEVGKYGTGFLTTHTFGRKFLINSTLKEGDYFFKIENFEIDRSPKTWQDLSDNIFDQKKEVYKLLEKGEILTETDLVTTFTYIPNTPKEFEYINKSSEDLDAYIPYVFTINERLYKVTIIDRNGNSTSYQKVSKTAIDNDCDIKLFKTTIRSNSQDHIIYSIVDDEYDIEIILPIDEENRVYKISERITKLFLYYPLIGSEKFGINFIINSKQFLPTEPRDGIHLKSDKDQIQEQEENNRKIIEKATSLVFEFLNSSIIEVDNPLLYAAVKFVTNSDNQLQNEYFENLQSEWNYELKKLPFVKTKNGFKDIDEVKYLSSDFITDDEDLFKVFYDLLDKFFGDELPVIEDIKTWSENAQDWNDDSIEFINHAILLEEIQNYKLDDFDINNLITYYKYLIENGKSNVFNEYTLIPNLDGEFNKIGHLLVADNLTNDLISLGRILINSQMKKIIDSRFIFDFDLDKFNRRDFTNEIKNEIDNLDLEDKVFFNSAINLNNTHQNLFNRSEEIDEEYYVALIEVCKYTSNVNSSSKPNKMVKEICIFYGLDSELKNINTLDVENENLDLRIIRKTVIRVFFNTISLHKENWVQENLNLVGVILNLWEDSYKELYNDCKIYPNQLFELCKAESLKRDEDILENIKTYYNEITNEQIEAKLIIKDFNDLLPKEEFINSQYLANKIQELIFNDDFTDYENHPHKELILKIIPLLNDKVYQILFQTLDSKKASIMINLITNEEKKEDIFSIVSLHEDKLKKIGKLIKKDNFEQILNIAESLAIEEQNQKANFEHKYKIGTYIEDKIRQKLNDELKSHITIDTIEAENVQGGQDIVVKLNDIPIHYIEVKSRWASNSSVMMSKLQLERAALNKDIYTLCSVDVTNYNGGNDKYELLIEEIIPLTKCVNNIGENIEPLVKRNLDAEKRIDDDIHLIEYKGIVPQNIIKSGESLDDCINKLVSKIQELDK
ncbi:sacsin N-terminal ATP-binding-like domain-containing protein [Sphingobacterium sp. CZ-2]|uniref:sacsin N-terminal ATP-binding-like domain-containing protein n=1 Tax=Sphingobacterium sp. CZ-2 TaxID=2557994 RepID=UPI00106FD7CC|nr:hypothetical protein [Sphingobacterium sp. CZ-2]QBR13218.1 hypothetical protein E3D81_14000 [Sphingobacterium sp. CZ-2]